MNSVYFPAHVVVLLRRLVNVVSTLSISNHYVSRGQPLPDDAPRLTTTTLPHHPSDALKNVERSLWKLRNSLDYSLTAREKVPLNYQKRTSQLGDASGVVLKAAMDLPKWLPGNWSWPSLFSFQPQVDGQSSGSAPPPEHRGQPSRRDDESDSNKSTRQEPPKKPFEPPQPQRPHLPDTIHQLLVNPALYDPLRAPRFPIVLCHGLYGFDSRGPSTFPSMRMHYWSNVLRVLRGKIGAEVIVTSVPGTGSITARAAKLDEQLKLHARGRGVNFLAHSMGGLDCRHLISHIRPKAYAPLSLMSIATPHRGSPFMDWCTTNIGIGKLRQQEKELKEELIRSSQRHDLHVSSSEYEEEDYGAAASARSSRDSRLASTSKSKPASKSEESSFSLSSLPSSFTTLILGIVDSPAYANLTSHYLNEIFNPATPDDPRVKYWSVAGRLSAKSVNIWHPFWLPKMVLDGTEETERERMKKGWEEKYRDREWKKEDGVPLWADEREWGNDGLVTIQSAKWGEFLGTMEGCDHWEMRGARGIEFGVDIPALPAIGLGSSPSSTSTTAREAQTQAAQGDGWGFGDWTRFVAWSNSKNDEAAAAVKKHESKSDHQTSPLSESTSSKSSLKDETRLEKRARERAADDDIVKSSTDRLSVVFDWLIERVPASGILTIPGITSDPKGKSKTKAEAGDNLRFSHGTDKVLRAAAATYNVGASSGSADRQDSTPQQPPSEMKKRMDREDTGRKKNELGSREDLERFYVALSRKMYDAGL